MSGRDTYGDYSNRRRFGQAGCRMVKDFLPNGLVSLTVLSGMSCFRFEPRTNGKIILWLS